MRFPRGWVSLRRAHLVWPLLLLLLVGAALTALLPASEEQHRGAEGDDDALGVSRRVAFNRPLPDPDHVDRAEDEATRDRFTIVIQTYNRTDLLLVLLNHYQAMPHLQKIIIVWNNVGEQPPQELWDSLGPHPVEVIFKVQSVNRMRNRLQSFPEIDTDAVLMLDDDTLISVPDISFAFSVWKQFPDQIVGFVPRKHVVTAGGTYSYGSFELQDPEIGGGDRYSMVLIGAAFFHHRYLRLFQEQPPAVHELVDQTQNCDDIAMNFVVSLYLAQQTRPFRGASAPGSKGAVAGVFVRPVDMRNLEKVAASGYLGMWHRPEHLLQRSYCLNRLAQIYGSMPLCFSNLMLCQFGFPNYANHKNIG